MMRRITRESRIWILIPAVYGGLALAQRWLSYAQGQGHLGRTQLGDVLLPLAFWLVSTLCIAGLTLFFLAAKERKVGMVFGVAALFCILGLVISVRTLNGYLYIV